jgi:hypothetical protein
MPQAVAKFAFQFGVHPKLNPLTLPFLNGYQLQCDLQSALQLLGHKNIQILLPRKYTFRRRLSCFRHRWIPNTNLAFFTETEQPSPVFEPRHISDAAIMPLQFQHDSTKQHVDDVDVGILAAAGKKAPTRRPIKFHAEIALRIRA